MMNLTWLLKGCRSSNMEEVKLLGAWSSPFLYRVIWALQLKGIAYEYIEEDLSNKSPLLLQYNPVHKKIPVLVHGGKAIAESVVILEYIEETWPQSQLMPKDAHGKAMIRFWMKFVDDKTESARPFFNTVEEEREKAMKESLEILGVIEEHGLGEKKFFSGDMIGLADLVFGAMDHWSQVLEEVLGIKLVEEKTFPRLYAWRQKFKEHPVIKENLPDRDKMLQAIKRRRETLLASPSYQ